MAETERFVAVCGLLTFVVLSIWAVFFVPMNMDEVLPYHVLACFDHPFAKLDIFQEGCDGRYDRITFFGLRISGAYHYVGLLSSVLYAPFYYLFHAPRVQYAYGLVFFLGFALLLARYSKKPQLCLPIILSFFPFVFQFVHDTGPVKFSLMCFPLGAVLARHMILSLSSALRCAYGIALALLILLAAEDKIFFVYLIPSFSFFCIAVLDELSWQRLYAQLVKSRIPLLLMAVIVLLGLVTLLFAQMGGGTYFDHLSRVGARLESEQGSKTVFITSLLLILTWPAYAHRVFDMQVSNMLPMIVSMLLCAALIVACLTLAIKRKLFLPLRPRTVLLGLSFFMSLFVFIGLGKVWAGHHFIFLWVPVLLLFSDLIAALAPTSLLTVTLCYFALNVLSMLVLTQEPIAINMRQDQEAIFDYFSDPQRAASAIVNYSSWGGYFIQALYGPKNQLITSKDPLDSVSAQKLLEIAQRTNRRVYDVCLDPLQETLFEGLPVNVGDKSFASLCDIEFLENQFGGKLKFEEVLPGLSTWHVYGAK